VRGKTGAAHQSYTVDLFISIETALVTGGGTGIGKTIASALVQNGAKVYIAARNEAQLKEVSTRPFACHTIPLCLMHLPDSRGAQRTRTRDSPVHRRKSERR